MYPFVADSLGCNCH